MTESPHIPHASLQAELHGEPLSEAQREHLASCPRCQAASEQVQRMQLLFERLRAEGPDELRWRRIRLGVKAQLKPQPSRRRPALWVVGGLAAAAVAATALVFAGPPSDTPEAVAQLEPAAPAPVAPTELAAAPLEPVQLPAFEVEGATEVPIARPALESVSKRRRGAISRPARRVQRPAGAASVQVEVDPARTAWELAQRAYYEAADYPEAVRQAKKVLAGRDLGLYRAAERLICDAQVANNAGRAAVKACAQLLGQLPREEERRVHLKIATVYRAQLKDCARAAQHYDRALSGAEDNILYDPARIQRARCAVELGDWAKAERTLSLLRSPGRAVRAAELDELEAELRRQHAKEGPELRR